MSLDFTITKNQETYTADDLLELHLYREKSPISETLAPDMLTFTVEADPASDLATSTYGDAFTFSEAGAPECKFYFRSIERVTKTRFKVSLFSAIGLLININHRGGIYNATPCGEIIKDIFRASYVGAADVSGVSKYSGIIDYWIEDSIASIPVYGHLKYQNARDALLAVLFAVGAGVFRNTSGDIYIKAPMIELAKSISDDDVYVGGSVKPVTPATLIRVTEHSFFAFADDQEKVLFSNADGSGAVSNKEVVFDAPMHDITASSGLSILESGANYAVVSGTGTLTGKEYTHTKRILEESTGVSGEEHIISCSSNTLVSMMNSANVASRIASYYTSAVEVTRDVVHGGELPGDYISFTSPYGDVVAGVIKSQNILISGKNKATTTIAKDYSPGHYGNTFIGYQLFTQDGTCTPPEGTGRIELIVVGGFKGGQGGTDGESGGASTYGGTFTGPWGTSPTTYTYTLPGKGGKAGKKGAGASGVKIKTATIISPDASYPVTIGVGGLGGEDGQDGSLGGDSTFGTISSAQGVESTDRIVNFVTGAVYNIPGSDGFDAGKGGDGEGIYSTISASTDGEDAVTTAATYKGGIHATGGEQIGGGWATSPAAGGGGGGGAAFGNNGGNGSKGTYRRNGTSPSATGGYGGDGASAVVEAQAALGHCGNGGSAGAGGGGEGSCYGPGISYGVQSAGGKGSRGQQGSDGLVLAYFFTE